jgi:beta-glucosidase
MPTASGPHTFSLTSSGLSRLYINGVEVIDNWSSQTRGDSFMGAGSAEKFAEVDVREGERLDIMIEYSKQSAGVLAGARVGAMPVVPGDPIAQAAAMAAEADVALVYVGTSGEWESEGQDRPDMKLVGKQGELIEAVAAANPRTVVILQTGSPIEMPWLDKPAAVLQAWFPGQECGNAIADVLFGKVDAAGRLPQTFPMRLQDNPTYVNYPGENGKVTYGEGIFVGYRYYDKKEVQPLFPFGYGLSYTTFEYSNLRLSAERFSPDEALEVSVDVSNTGERAGSEVVQLYVSDEQPSLARPPKELKRFAKIALAPGETRTVTFSLDRRAFAYWDDLSHRWVAEAGDFTILLGSSSADIRLTAGVSLNSTARFDGPGRKSERLTLNSTIKALMSDEHAVEMLERRLPGFTTNPQLGFALGFSLRQLAGFDAETFTPELLSAIESDLELLSK